MDQPQNFFQTLFDFSFAEFVTPKIIKILYGIGIFLAAIAAVAFIIGGFGDSFGKGILFLILSPFVFVIYVILARVWLEIIIVIFKISGNIEEIAKAKKE